MKQSRKGADVRYLAAMTEMYEQKIFRPIDIARKHKISNTIGALLKELNYAKHEERGISKYIGDKPTIKDANNVLKAQRKRFNTLRNKLKDNYNLELSLTKPTQPAGKPKPSPSLDTKPATGLVMFASTSLVVRLLQLPFFAASSLITALDGYIRNLIRFVKG